MMAEYVCLQVVIGQCGLATGRDATSQQPGGQFVQIFCSRSRRVRSPACPGLCWSSSFWPLHGRRTARLWRRQFQVFAGRLRFWPLHALRLSATAKTRTKKGHSLDRNQPCHYGQRGCQSMARGSWDHALQRAQSTNGFYGLLPLLVAIPWSRPLAGPFCSPETHFVNY
jgi:hypothetical protein